MTKKLNPDEMGRLLLTEQLRRKGYTLEQAKALNSPGDETRWLKAIRWADQAEADDFRNWAITQLVTRSERRVTQSDAERVFSWWDLAQGLGVGPLPVPPVMP